MMAALGGVEMAKIDAGIKFTPGVGRAPQQNIGQVILIKQKKRRKRNKKINKKLKG